MAGLVELRAGVACWCDNERVTITCKPCGRTLPAEQFTAWGVQRQVCRDCASARNREYGQANRERRNERLREWRRMNPEAARQKDIRARLMRKYRLTPSQVEEMRDAQAGRCFLCDSADRVLVVDHCHETGRVRGLLCRSCNTVVGQIEAAPTIVDRLAAYLGHEITSPGLASSSNTSA